jgi:hypothetical protein
MSTRVADPTEREQQLIRDCFQVKNRISPDELHDLYGKDETNFVGVRAGVALLGRKYQQRQSREHRHCACCLLSRSHSCGALLPGVSCSLNGIFVASS